MFVDYLHVLLALAGLHDRQRPSCIRKARA